MWKDMLLALFNLIDYNHSGSFFRFEYLSIHLSLQVLLVEMNFLILLNLSSTVKMVLVMLMKPMWKN